MALSTITFFYPFQDELNSLNELDVGSFRVLGDDGEERRRAWIIQTYLWLRRRGYKVEISASLPPKGIVVLLTERAFRQAFLDQYEHSKHRSIFVATIRADIIGFRSPLGHADIVQNGRFSNGKDAFYVPHWPQPGLVPRNASRGTTIKNVVFKGGVGSLRDEFRSPSWQSYLDRRGMTFNIAATGAQGNVPKWHDYSSADLVLAVRPSFEDGSLRCEKPASKLINAWHAGVPALLGPEYAYRELRQSPFDYIEVESVKEARVQTDRLRNNPTLYQRMVEQGRRRAKAFTHERITEQWAELLFEKIPRLQGNLMVRFSQSIPFGPRQVFNWLSMPPTPFELRKQIGYFSHKLRNS